MILINLLPHRELKRQRRKQAFFVGMGFAVVVGALLVGLAYVILQQMVAAQQGRNNFLSSEIQKLELRIKDIATLKSEIESLKSRQKAVEDLQIDRNVPVHLLNELSKQTPEGIYITAVKQDGQNLLISGIAQTNERVSEFLRNTGNNSEWLVKPELVEIKAANVQAANKEQKRLFDFSMRVSVKRPQDLAAAEAASAAALTAASWAASSSASRLPASANPPSSAAATNKP